MLRGLGVLSLGPPDAPSLEEVFVATFSVLAFFTSETKGMNDKKMLRTDKVTRCTGMA